MLSQRSLPFPRILRRHEQRTAGPDKGGALGSDTEGRRSAANNLWEALDAIYSGAGAGSGSLA
jgi:hypothetical protein